MSAKPRIAITYCTQCHWLLRAAWMAQELLSTFGDEVGEVALRPATGGVFHIEVESEIIWERKRDGGFPPVPRQSAPWTKAQMRLFLMLFSGAAAWILASHLRRPRSARGMGSIAGFFFFFRF